jgi:hypothetical protein
MDRGSVTLNSGRKRRGPLVSAAAANDAHPEYHQSTTEDGRKLLLGLGASRVRMGIVECGESGTGKILAEGPHSQIAEDPQRGWTKDL